MRGALLVLLVLSASQAHATTIIFPASFESIDTERPNPAVLAGTVTPFDSSLGRLTHAQVAFRGSLIGRLTLPAPDSLDHGYTTIVSIRLESKDLTLFEAEQTLSFNIASPTGGRLQMDDGNVFGFMIDIEDPPALAHFRARHPLMLSVEARMLTLGSTYSADTIRGTAGIVGGVTYEYTPRAPRLSGAEQAIPQPEPSAALLVLLGISGAIARRAKRP